MPDAMPRLDAKAMKPHPSPWRVLLAIGMGTCLSLLGDATLYAVLPTHTVEVGISIGTVGILLSANRWIRLALNGPMGWAYDRFKRRPLFLISLFIGALSTALYSLAQGFWPLLLARLLWGLSWAGIWVGGNAIILEICGEDDRGRWVGRYHFTFFLGAALGFFLGGLLTDRLGYHLTMAVHAALTLLGFLCAFILLPETKGACQPHRDGSAEEHRRYAEQAPSDRAAFLSATALYSVNRLVMAGALTSTLGLFIAQQFGDPTALAHGAFGVATLTGIALGMSTLISMFASPIWGTLSDQAGNRWRVVALGLLPGVVGFCLLARGSLLSIFTSIPLAAITSGSNHSLSTTIAGEVGRREKRGRNLGLLFTLGDLASAIGPPLAYALIPLIRIEGIYRASACFFAIFFLFSLRNSLPTRQSRG